MILKWIRVVRSPQCVCLRRPKLTAHAPPRGVGSVRTTEQVASLVARREGEAPVRGELRASRRVPEQAGWRATVAGWPTRGLMCVLPRTHRRFRALLWLKLRE